MAQRRNSNLGRRRGWRVERFESIRQIAQCVSHRLEDKGCRIMLGSVEILARKLAGTDHNSVVTPAFLKPPGIQTKRLLAGHPAGAGDQAKTFAQIPTALPQAGGMEVHAIPMQQRAEVNVHRSADTVPNLELRRRTTLRSPQRVADVLDVEVNAYLVQPASQSAPIA